MKKYFREQPPIELIHKAIRSLGLDSLFDTRWVEESFLSGDLMVEVMQEIRPYYIPCHAKTYLDKNDFGYADYICLVRQMLRTKDSTFERRERSVKVDKNTFRYIPQYRIKVKTILPSEAFEVEFR